MCTLDMYQASATRKASKNDRRWRNTDQSNSSGVPTETCLFHTKHGIVGNTHACKLGAGFGMVGRVVPII